MKITDSKPRMTPEDIAVLKAMFEERDGAVEVIRKIFYPQLTADNPIHSNQDMWYPGLDLSNMTNEQKIIAVEAHGKLVKHVEGCLAIIKMLVGEKNESPEQVLKRLQQNSSK